MGRKPGHLGLTAWSEFVAILSFLLMLVIPGVTMLVSRQQVKLAVNKQAPITSVVDYYTRFKDRFRQTFGFRTALLGLHERIKTDWLGVSPSHQVLFGKQGWLFYAEDNEIRCSRHSQFNEEQLRYWAALLEARRVFLEKKGIHYLFLVAPDKHTIYPEHLPEVMLPVKPLSRTDQLIGYVGKQTKVRILDVRPAMVGAKPLGRLYFLTDTHWNTLGAFIAYQQIMGRVQTWYPEVKPLQLTDYSWEDLKFSGDLASMVALQSTPTEIGKALRPKFKSSTRWISDAGELFNSPRVIIDNLRSENPNAPIPKLVMFRDSFATTLLPYIAEHFHNAFFHWGDFETSVVEREKPDIVIEELLERRLMKGLPKMP